MKSPFILASALLSVTLLFLVFTVRSSADGCQPTGTNISETTNGCPTVTGEPTDISKSGAWNINWPDGFAGGLTASGTGQCHNNWDCCAFVTGRTECWPEFHQPVATSTGQFSILVENKVVRPEPKSVPTLAPQREEEFGVTFQDKLPSPNSMIVFGVEARAGNGASFRTLMDGVLDPLTPKMAVGKVSMTTRGDVAVIIK